MFHDAIDKSYALDKNIPKCSSFITICPDNIKILEALKSPGGSRFTSHFLIQIIWHTYRLTATGESWFWFPLIIEIAFRNINKP